MNKRNAFFITVCLSGTIMLFPWALRSGLIYWWVLLILAFFIFVTLWPRLLLDHTKNYCVAYEVSVTEENIGKIEFAVAEYKEEPAEETEELTEYKEEPAEETEELTEYEEEPAEEIEELTEEKESLSKKSIEEFIDLGFQEKQADNFELAAFYFFQALKLDPMPDLAFSLITECYWLWNNLDKRDFALYQLQTYIQKYILLDDSDLYLQFYAWMVKENIQNN